MFDVLREDGQYKIFRDGVFVHASYNHPGLLYDLLGIFHAQALETFAGYIRIHAGCGEYKGRRFLVIGDKGAGKSTLMMRLLFDGLRADGDELVLIKNEDVTPFPRRFHLKEGSIDLLPELQSMISSVPYIQLYNGLLLYSFSPRDAGYDWKIQTRKTDVIFYLEPDHSDKTKIEECPKYIMAEKVMARSFLSESYDYLKIGQICRIVNNAECYTLHVSSLENAAVTIRELLAKPARATTASAW